MDETGARPEGVVEDLVLAMLAVDNWTLEHTFALRDGLARECLFDPDALINMSPAEVFDRLARAGCQRGDFMTGLIADRLLHMANQLAGEGKAKLAQLVAQPSNDLDQYLITIKGVGPAVLKKFKTLRGIE